MAQRQHPVSAKISGRAGTGQPMKRLLNNHSAKRASESGQMRQNRSEVVQIITRNSGFSTEQPGANVAQTPISNGQSEEQKKLTTLQLYNRMQQAKLLGRHSNKYPAQCPNVKKGTNALSSLLRYPSPKAKSTQKQPSLDNSSVESNSAIQV